MSAASVSGRDGGTSVSSSPSSERSVRTVGVAASLTHRSRSGKRSAQDDGRSHPSRPSSRTATRPRCSVVAGQPREWPEHRPSARSAPARPARPAATAPGAATARSPRSSTGSWYASRSAASASASARPGRDAFLGRHVARGKRHPSHGREQLLGHRVVPERLDHVRHEVALALEETGASATFTATAAQATTGSGWVSAAM